MIKRSPVTTPIVVNMISESEFTVQGHGVHTAYREMTTALKQRDDVDVAVNTQRPADIIHVHTVGMYALGKLLRCGKAKKVISAHLVPDSFIGSLRAAKYWRPVGALWLKFFYNRADVLLAVSEETAAELRRMDIRKPITVLHNIVNSAAYRPTKDTPGRCQALRSSLGIADDAFVVVGAGQTQPRKRIDTFMRVAQELPEVQFVWVGGMPFGQLAASSTAMKSMMHEAPSNVHFTGLVPLEDMPIYYQMSNVFMLPSDQETFGLVVVEAAAAGLPVLLRDIPDYDGTFRGHAIMAVDDDEFIKRIKQLMEDAAYYQAAQQDAAAIAQRFDSKTGGQLLVDCYRQLLHGTEGSSCA